MVSKEESIFHSSNKYLDKLEAIDIIANWSDIKLVQALEMLYKRKIKDSCFICLVEMIGKLLIKLNCKRESRGENRVDMSLFSIPVLKNVEKFVDRL